MFARSVYNLKINILSSDYRILKNKKSKVHILFYYKMNHSRKNVIDATSPRVDKYW